MKLDFYRRKIDLRQTFCLGDPFQASFIDKLLEKEGKQEISKINQQKIILKTSGTHFHNGETRFQKAETRFQNAKTR